MALVPSPPLERRPGSVEDHCLSSSSSSCSNANNTGSCQCVPGPRTPVKFFESDVRSSLVQPGPINNTSILRPHTSMREPVIHTSLTSPCLTPSSDCLDCLFVDCSDVDCLAECKPSPESCNSFEKCPFAAADHDSLDSLCIDPVCEMDKCIEGCDAASACDGNFEEFLQCCTDYHSYVGSSALDPTSSQMSWDTWNDLLNTQSAPFPLPSSPRMSADQTRSFFPLPSSIQTTQSGSPLPTFQQTPGFSGTQARMSSPHIQHRNGPSSTGNNTARGAPLTCLWGNCGLTFNTINELVGHVNLMHLRPSSSPRSAPGFMGNRGQSSMDTSNNALSCMWGDCQTFPASQGFGGAFPGPSSTTSGSQLDAAALMTLSSHLFQDHLGLPMQQLQPQPSMQQRSNQGFGFPPPGNSQQFRNYNHSRQSTAPNTGMPSPNSSPSLTPEPHASDDADPSATTDTTHNCASSAHICHWTSCMLSFPTCDALTAHISSAHVGSGRSHYDCYWSGCNRNGDQGFASKQKILRHLQSHTGHRPFQCQICNQNFSEAATLQQHMRRHTQEKPYVCDFPGCGKAFAITGALTIHKRTHNGERPFKCPNCDKAFAESSNLAKHLRTHTGARPYPCPEPGCDKCFARPDQLQRHMNVHTKKNAKAAQSSSTPGSGGTLVR